MDYKAPVEAYTGVVREVAIGKGNKSLKIGGENIDLTSLSAKEAEYVKTARVLKGETLYSDAWLET